MKYRDDSDRLTYINRLKSVRAMAVKKGQRSWFSVPQFTEVVGVILDSMDVCCRTARDGDYRFDVRSNSAYLESKS